MMNIKSIHFSVQHRNLLHIHGWQQQQEKRFTWLVFSWNRSTLKHWFLSWRFLPAHFSKIQLKLSCPYYTIQCSYFALQLQEDNVIYITFANRSPCTIFLKLILSENNFNFIGQSQTNSLVTWTNLNLMQSTLFLWPTAILVIYMSGER